MRPRRARLLACLALGLTGAGPALLAGAALSPAPALAQSRPAQGDALSAELLRRLSEYQAEIQRLTAEVEQLSFRLRQSEAAAAARLTDLEMRLTEMEGGDPMAALTGAPSTPAPVQPAPPPTATVAPPSPGASPPGLAPGPQPLGTLRQQGSPADERAALDAAASDLATQGVEMGQLSLGAFIERHPGSPLIGEAYHLLGVAFYRAGRYNEAARQFLVGVRDHPATPMAANNLVGLGETLVALGKFDDACAALRELPTRYPAAPPALLTRADAARTRAGGCR